MAKRVTGMGRGLDALLPPEDLSNRLSEMRKDLPVESVEQVTEGKLQELPLAEILTSAEQPRKYFNELTISELAQSIFERGLLQPILVTTLKEATGKAKYRIIAGERRFRACGVLKWQRIPAIVKAVSEFEHFELALIENIQRENLTPIEEALAYEHLLRVSGASQQEIAKKLGKGRSALANSLRLLQLPSAIQDGLSKGLIRSGHARALLMIKDPKALLEAYHLCLEESWSVRQTEKHAQQLLENKEERPSLPKMLSPHVPNSQVQSLQVQNPQVQDSIDDQSDIQTQPEKTVQKRVDEVPQGGLGSVPGLWYANGIPLRKKDLQTRISKALTLNVVALELDGHLEVPEEGQPGACPQKATLKVEFRSKEDWQHYLSALGLPLVLSSSSSTVVSEDKIKNSTLEISIDKSEDDALFSADDQ